MRYFEAQNSNYKKNASKKTVSIGNPIIYIITNKPISNN